MDSEHLNVLLIGSGVIGSVYAAQFALSGHEVSVLPHGTREQYLEENGLRIKNVAGGAAEEAFVEVAADVATTKFDLVIVAVRADQLSSVFPTLRTCIGQPHIVFFGNNPDGHNAIPDDIPGTVQLAFPGLSGSIVDQVVEYTLVDQQATALEADSSPMNSQMHKIFAGRGLKVQDIVDMNGWLKYHAVFISCISAAILQSNGNTLQLGKDTRLLKLTCRAIEEGFYALKLQNISGAPKNLLVLHSRWLRPIAVYYWKKVLLSDKGELYFGAHARHAPGEVTALSEWVLRQTSVCKNTQHIQRLLAPAPAIAE